ncbi:DUF4214 domain-containing protein [Octadecabacter sp. 1_MG-2023]|uniref:DUF4214 domain-containing protein n=1 Tax=unclassified Octadecabacter TaxID=196158 RepID=UPI001C08202E|nr:MULTISPECIES: DUF4214 domain-containing protein [unclassified Octadecabacter]MBU2993858.1 DUF4214 domain-containing protein [Octadecabacter sp. B2R22]MDO6735296.1 DUF4214 domain-containing protein [Octadecabacter sp. 1_MG-2023]
MASINPEVRFDSISDAVLFTNTFVQGGWVFPSPSYGFLESADGIEFIRPNSLASTGYYSIDPTVTVSGTDLSVNEFGLLTGTITDLKFSSTNRGTVFTVAGAAFDGSEFTEILLGRMEGDNLSNDKFDQLIGEGLGQIILGDDDDTVSMRGFIEYLNAFDLGAGDDLFRASAPSQDGLTIMGGDGYDILSLGDFGVPDPFVVDLSSGTVHARDVSFLFSGFEEISGNPHVERYIGSQEGDIINAAGRDDFMIGNAGNDVLSGGYGDDLIFGDKLPIGYFSEDGASVYRLYQATLGREPDANGHQNWTTRVATDELSLLQAANGFVNSTEFQNTYGALENADFVNLLYQNVLNRDADDTGLARWVGDLEDGLSRAQVVLGFSNSGEFKNNTATDAAQFGQGNTQQIWTDDVFRLYQATLDRTPDEAGMFNRTERLGSGTEYLDEAAGFVNSTEFKNRFGDDLSNAEFVELMYQNVLGRAADDTGLARWVGDLEDGASRTEVVQGFAQSSEFRNNTAEALEDWMRDNAASDEIVGGEGDDVMAGGFGSDLFVFRQADAGSDVVLDLEAWDGIDITDFEFGDLATAQAAFTQDGTDVVFASGNVEVVFEGTDLADFDDGMLFV